MKLRAPKVSVPKLKLNHKTVIKTVIVAVAVLGIAGLVTAVGAHWHEKQNVKAEHAAAIAAQQKQKDDAYAAQTKKLAKLQAAYDNERVNCEKGEAIYNNVSTPAQKKIVESKKGIPACGPAVLQF